jgi:hypothetical protein
MVWYSQLEYPSCCIDMGSEHVTAIDVKTIPNRDERRSVGFGTNAARRGAGQSRAFSRPCLVRELRALSPTDHGQYNNISHQRLSLSSSLTMAFSTAEVVCCLRLSHHIPSSRLYRRLINGKRSQFLRALAISWHTIVHFLKSLLFVHFMCPDTCAKRPDHPHQPR